MLLRVLTMTDDLEIRLAVRHSLCRIEMWRAPTVTGRDTLLRLAADAADRARQWPCSQMQHWPAWR